MDNPKLRANICDMDTDIVITGGGLAGTSLALALAQTGMTVTLVDALSVDAQRQTDFDGRSYAIALSSQRLLQTLGIWPALDADAQPMLDIKVTDGRAGEGPSPFFLHFDHAEIEEGPMGYMIEDRHLRRALLDAVATTSGITHRPSTQVTAQNTAGPGVTVTLSTGDTISAALLIGADGRSSGTAERAGIRRMAWGYDQTALVCAIAHEKPHNGVAHQFFMPPGPLAILPLTGNRSSIVWSETTQNAARINALSDAAYLEHLRPRFGSFLGEISLAGARFTYPLGLSLANSFIAPRLALVADAAHGMHPIAGQGLNAGLRDVAALAEVLCDARRRGEDLGAPTVLDRYQQWRRFDTAALALATDSFNRLFSNDNPILRFARDIGMGAVQSIPALRRGFIREAAGLTGELPKLLRGQPL
ncbi:2-octaprenyl-6-methoxyphenyl hydroxylase [Aliishimia ponticola]|uniref:2-octaprenyl-6-methoxyphenyl hydroxylase n=1 Tax=Aliishimia ponticola TaxID=2499833 RepID=A0A4V3XKE5_9RHOB|nr:FAD-dependent monooxygenase [Aliishimia ponticola]THH36633.1 2-octaprenyl-6-methoxyphenyl hydroxylase [Aliishimia ponticola]